MLRSSRWLSISNRYPIKGTCGLMPCWAVIPAVSTSGRRVLPRHAVLVRGTQSRV